jgi:Leucine-rich repeat (LRR) protein
LRNLTHLDIRHNSLKSLPQSICGLTNLEYLDACDNKLSTLPDGITQLHKLEKVGLDYNKLIRLPEDIGYMTSLRLLSIWYNHLAELPESIAYNKNLQYEHPNYFYSRRVGDDANRIIKEQSRIYYNIAKMRIFIRTYFVLALGCNILVTQAVLLTTPPISL